MRAPVAPTAGMPRRARLPAMRLREGRCDGTDAERVVHSAKMCRGDMRRHICGPIDACIAANRANRTRAVRAVRPAPVSS